jgi:hypothetical protein
MVTGTRTKQGLRDAAVLYCLRVIDQCERSQSIPVLKWSQSPTTLTRIIYKICTQQQAK